MRDGVDKDVRSAKSLLSKECRFGDRQKPRNRAVLITTLAQVLRARRWLQRYSLFQLWQIWTGFGATTWKSPALCPLSCLPGERVTKVRLCGRTCWQAPEAMVLEVVSKKVCNRNVLAQLPNPKGYALHHPTLHYECEDVLENFGDGLIDALTLGEDIAAFCWDVDICGSSDGRLFDFELEDDDDLEESSSEPSKRKGREDL
ncbi:unnamed protein product [Effrenium voratum]|nr:unnamed protein product [Effrenium voratum]